MPIFSIAEYKEREHELELRDFWNQWTSNVEDNKALGYLAALPDVSDIGISGDTVIVIGAGPSVYANIESLAELAKKYPIVAVDRIFEFLYRNGIHPDVVVTGDKSGRCANFVACADKAHKTKFVASIVSSPATIKAMVDTGVHVYLHSHEPEDSFFWGCFHDENECGFTQLKQGTVVTFVAVELAVVAMGAKCVITIGNDLCVMKDDKEALDRELRTNRQLIMLTDEKTCMPPAFLLAQASFSSFSGNRPDVEFIDCSGGLKKHGWKTADISEVLNV